jgi:copper chaperone CopZ
MPPSASSPSNSHASLSQTPSSPSFLCYHRLACSSELGPEAKALFSIIGMTCSACAGSVEKAIKRLPGIREAIVDVLNNKAHILFYPSFVNVNYSLSISGFCLISCFLKKNVVNGLFLVCGFTGFGFFGLILLIF